MASLMSGWLVIGGYSITKGVVAIFSYHDQFKMEQS